MQYLNPAVFLDEFFRTVKNEKSLLLLDYDGTLAPFNEDPLKASPYPEVLVQVQEIVERKRTKVVIISGRELKTLSSLLLLHSLPEIWGSHGAERLTVNGEYTLQKPSEHCRQGLAKAQEFCYQHLPFARYESKPASFAIHWRGWDEAAQALIPEIQKTFEEIARESDLKLCPFDGGLELMGQDWNKGKAVETLLHDSSYQAIAYLGDDLTDEDAFRVLGSQGLKILVRKELRPTLADIQLTPPHEVVDFLKRWNQVQ